MPNERARPCDILHVQERDPLWAGQGEQGGVRSGADLPHPSSEPMLDETYVLVATS